jgi:hypothetical protein
MVRDRKRHSAVQFRIVKIADAPADNEIAIQIKRSVGHLG